MQICLNLLNLEIILQNINIVKTYNYEFTLLILGSYEWEY